ncbi:hypothetical protein [Spirosoma aerolatum]|uniref:hypothetical protein n=1 Tax=Spirosoma aerolatum TaxID=1211326 RepID=UPI0009AD6216|nr:hypothetical protein [Spirosoma aerolatum]
MNKEKKPQTSAEVTEEVLAGWKQKFGEVFIVEVAKDAVDPENVFDGVEFELEDGAEIAGDKFIGYLRKPNKQIRAMAYSSLGVGGYMEAAKNMLKACWLGGDNEILLNEARLHFAASQIADWIQIYQASLKKA